MGKIKVLEQLEWILSGTISRCYICGRTREQGHRDGCAMQRALNQPANEEVKQLRRECKALKQELARRDGEEMMAGGRECLRGDGK